LQAVGVDLIGEHEHEGGDISLEPHDLDQSGAPVLFIQPFIEGWRRWYIDRQGAPECDRCFVRGIDLDDRGPAADQDASAGIQLRSLPYRGRQSLQVAPDHVDLRHAYLLSPTDGRSGDSPGAKVELIPEGAWVLRGRYNAHGCGSGAARADQLPSLASPFVLAKSATEGTLVLRRHVT
jgi:hypothetical protein